MLQRLSHMDDTS